MPRKPRDYQEEYERNLLASIQSGCNKNLIVSPTGCHRADQPILMHDGTTKRADAVIVGDILMGPASQPRTVLGLCQGEGRMVEVIPTKGTPFVVNEDHILTLVRTRESSKPWAVDRLAGATVDIPLSVYLNSSRWFQHIHKLFRQGACFKPRPRLPLNPYYLGLMLGDGCIQTMGICANDAEIIEAITAEASARGMRVALNGIGTHTKYAIVGQKGHENPIRTILEDLWLNRSKAGDKFIPTAYKLSHMGNRLEVLAGLLDTDGSYANGGYDYISKSQQLANDVAFIARSAGLAAYVVPCTKTAQNGFSGVYHRVSISGNCHRIPCRVARKSAFRRQQKKDVLRTGLAVRELGKEAYYGFTLDADGRYLLGDFTVTHNSGKGFMVGRAPKCLQIKRGEKMLVVVHRKDLVTQLTQSLRDENPDLNVDIERAHLRADVSADVVVASIQSLGKSSGDKDAGTEDYNERLRRFNPDQFRHILIDECHLAPKAGGDYHRVLRYFNVSKRDFLNDDPGKTLTCYTATANRSDNIGMENIVDAMPFSRDILTMMRSGLMVNGELRTWLALNRSYRCDTEVDIRDVGTNKGDFAVKELEDAVNTQARNELIVEKHRELGEGMTFFAFTVDVQHTNDLSATFQRAGFKAYPYSGTTPDGERRRLMAAIRAREIDGLISCDALTVGVDVPNIGVLHFARPTKSPLLFQQQFGRGARPSPAPEEYAAWKGWVKPYFVTIDYVDVCSKHPAQSVPNLFGLRPDFNMKGKKAAEVVEEVEKLVAKAPGVNLALFTDVDKLRGAVQEINLFGKPTIPPEITQNSQLAWTTGMANGVYQLSFDKSLLTISQDTLGRFQIYRHVQGIRTPLGQAGDLQRALSLAEIEVPSEWYVRLQADAQWRFQPPSEAQLGFYAKLYPEVRKLYASNTDFAEGIKKRYDKGELSMLITQRAKPRGKPTWAGRGA